MKHFMKLGDLDVLPIMRAVQFADLWVGETIEVRSDGAFTDAWQKLPQLRPLVFSLMRIAEATALESVAIERVPPSKAFLISGDGTRYQVMLQALPGVSLQIGEEVVHPKAADVWMWRISEDVPVELANASGDDAIFIVIDLDHG